jgi:hypothetical protein
MVVGYETGMQLNISEKVKIVRVVNQAQRHEDLWGMEVQFLTCSNLSLD